MITAFVILKLSLFSQGKCFKELKGEFGRSVGRANPYQNRVLSPSYAECCGCVPIRQKFSDSRAQLNGSVMDTTAKKIRIRYSINNALVGPALCACV